MLWLASPTSFIRQCAVTGGDIRHAARLAKRNRSDFYTLLRRHELEPGDFKEVGD